MKGKHCRPGSQVDRRCVDICASQEKPEINASEPYARPQVYASGQFFCRCIGQQRRSAQFNFVLEKKDFMRRAAVTVTFLGLLAGGCSISPAKRDDAALSKRNDDSPSGPVLKQFLARTDGVLVKHFFAPQLILSPEKGEFLSPGHIELGPLIAYEPGKEAEGHRGVRVEVVSSYVRANDFSHADNHVSFLDENEAKDLSSALAYMQQVNQTWGAAAPSDDVEVMFASKDDFQVSLLPDAKNGNRLFIESGNAPLSLPASFAAQLKEKLDSEIETLANNNK